MKEYTVAYIKNGEEYAYDNYISGTTIPEIVKVLTYEMNCYGVNYDEIAIFDVHDDDPAVYFVAVKNYGVYELVEMR